MAYDPNNLSALTSAIGFTLWHYKTPDSAADVAQTGYFDEAASLLRVGEIVFLNASIYATTEIAQLAVTRNERGTVDIAFMTMVVAAPTRARRALEPGSRGASYD